MDAVVGPVSGGFLEFVPLLSDCFLVGVNTHKLRTDFRQRAQNSPVGVVVFIDPKSGETLGAFHDGEVVRGVFDVHVLQEVRRLLNGCHENRPALFGEFIDRLESVPCPGFDALAQGVVNDDADVHRFRLVLGQCFLKL